MEKNETKTQNNKGLKILKTIVNTIINILIVVVLITSLLIAVMALTSKANGVSTIFGHTIQTIQSDSMKGGSPDGYGGKDFGNGDLMIAKSTKDDPKAEYEKGDIVTFVVEDAEGNHAYIVHRIVDYITDKSGERTYQTWGDNREVSEVPDQLDKSEYILGDDFVSVYYKDGYEGTIIKGAGGFLDYLRSQQGFFLVVLLPMIIFFMYELVRVVLNATSYRKAKADEIKQEAVDTAVAEALAAKEAENKAPASPSELTPEQMEKFKQFLESQKDQGNGNDSGSEG